MTLRFGGLVLLEARPDRAADLAAFLVAARELALREEGTVTWYAFKISDTTYGFFDTFGTVEDRQAHIDGEIPKALAAVGTDLLATFPRHSPCRHPRREVAPARLTRSPGRLLRQSPTGERPASSADRCGAGSGRPHDAPDVAAQCRSWQGSLVQPLAAYHASGSATLLRVPRSPSRGATPTQRARKRTRGRCPLD